MGKYQYDNAQICLSGHVITHRAIECSDETKKYCSECGEPTIVNCPNCSNSIKGYYSGDSWDALMLENYIRPNYCHECGSPYPWTQNALIETSKLIDDDTKLEASEKDEFKQTVNNLIKGRCSASKFKTFIKNVSYGTAESLKDVLVNVLSQAIIKSIWP